MADYEGWARSNYFKVKDIEEFKAFLEGRGLEILGELEEGNIAICPRDGWGWPACYTSDEGEEVGLDLAAELGPHLAHGQVAILMEAGHAKLRYVYGSALAIAWDGRTERQYLSDIYKLVERTFGVSSVTVAEY